MKKVFIIILNFNGGKDTAQCLESIGKLQITNYKLQIIVVDNGSRDGSIEKIKNEKLKMKNDNLKLKIIENKENLGFAEGNNVGIRYALKNKASYILLLNNDTLVDKNLVGELLKAMEEKTVGIAGPKIYFAAGFEYHHDRYKEEEQGRVIWYAGGVIDWKNVLAYHRGVDEVDRGQYDQQVKTDFVSGCGMFVKREVFEKIGLLDEKYFLYWEDVEFCQRAKKAGFKIIYTSQAKLWHLNTSCSVVGGPLQDYYLTRNRMLFGMRYASWRTKFALVKESIKLLFTGREWQKIGIRDFYLRKIKKGSWRD